MSGTIGILNVGCGDTKLSFDKDNPADCIRAARIVKDMLRRGYALLVEIVQANGAKTYQRVYEFKEDTFEYVIADLDPVTAAKADSEEVTDEPSTEASATSATPSRTESRPRPRLRTKTVSATETRGVAVARTAGG